MAVSDEVAPDEWECRVFLAVVEHRQHTKAAEALSPARPRHLRDRPYARQLVGKTIRRIERWCGEPLFEGDRGQLRLTARGREFERAARGVVGEYELMRGFVLDEGLPRLACLPHHALFVAPAQARLRERFGRQRIAVDYLPPDQLRMRHHTPGLGRHALLVGPPRPPEGTRSAPLYTARLEAMVPAAHFGAARLTVVELRQRYRPVLHLPGVPDDRLAAWGLDRAAPTLGDPATAVLRLRHEASGAQWDGRVLVVPSDVALAFKPGMEFGGRRADRFRWVPVVAAGDGGAALTHEVRLSVRPSLDDEAVEAAATALQAAARALPALSGGDP
ncbi:LysR family transcriptional regulator [Dactylosporangium darangshiense]|uniref:LysR family transcriptional regulator n=1 Tax=Dactylosporangium darangshiense TaxID=579108 RepID=A0ABP8D376_9ACTN